MTKVKDGFYKNIGGAIGNDSYVLLAGGGHKAESSLSVASAVNADKLDNIHAVDLFTNFSNAGNQTTSITIGGTNRTLKIDADTVDGKHATELFTNFSNAGSQTTSITIGGTNKTLKIDADTVDLYHASNIYQAASYKISNYSSTNDWLQIAKITFPNDDNLSMAGFSLLFSNRECLDKTSFILILSIRRNTRTSITTNFHYIPLQETDPKQLLLRSNDNVTFYVYFKSALNTWTTYYNVTKLMTEGNIDFTTIGLPEANLISGSKTNLTATRGGRVLWANSANTATKWETARTLALTGSVTGSATIDGSGNVTLATTTNHNHDDRYVNITGDTMTGTLTINSSVNGNYNEGLRITRAANNWAGITFGSTGTSGAPTNGWFVATNPSNQFIINPDDSGNTAGLQLNKNGDLKWRNNIVAHAGNISNKDATIGTSSTTIATIAGVNITAKIGSYSPSGHTHTFASITNKITAGNEFNFVDAEQSTIWFNYRRASGNAATTATTQFNFAQGTNSGTYAYLMGEGFKKNGSSDSYVLLGGGGHKAESSLSVNYANNAGNADTVDGYHASKLLHLDGYYYIPGNNNNGSTNFWSKIGSMTFTGAWQQCGASLTFYEWESRRMMGELKFNIRTTSSKSTAGASIVWMNLTNRDFESSFIICRTGDGTYDIYFKYPASSYNNVRFYIISQYDDNYLTWQNGSALTSTEPTYVNERFVSGLTSWVGNATASAGYLRDRSTGTATYANYGATGLGLSSITWITCWNGYELRAISKGELGGLTNVYQHTGNNVDYPLVWSNQNNTSTVQANQLYKSYADLVYNPENKTIKTTLFHSNASASEHNYTHIPTSAEIALETGNGNGGISAWIWRENYTASNWGIFHNNSTDYLHIVGNSTSRLSINLSGGNVGIGTDSPSQKLHVNGGIIQINANSRYVQIGPQNSSWTHFQSDTNFYFSPSVYVDGNIYLYGTSVRMQKSNGYVYSSGFYHNSYGSPTYLLRSDGGVSAFNWSGQSGQPTWIWGGNSQHTYYVYNPSNFSVNYANSAGNADTVDGHHQDHLLPYRYTYGEQTNSGSTDWYIRIQTESYISVDCTIYVRGGGNNTVSDFVLHVLCRENRFWGWQTSYNGVRINGIAKETSAPEIIYLRMPSSTTSITFKSTHSLTIDKADYSSKNYMDISQEGLFANYILGRIQNADYATSAGTANSVSWSNVTSGTNSQTLYLNFPSFVFRDANGNWIFGKDNNSTGEIHIGSTIVAQPISLDTSNGSLYLSSSGNVGIGTKSPSYKLHVSGDSYTTGWSRAVNGFYCEGYGVHFTHYSSYAEIYTSSNNLLNLTTGSWSTLYINYGAGKVGGTWVTHFIWNAGSTSTYAGHTAGYLNLFPGSRSNWGEGIRIHSASNGWTSLILCGTDNTGDSGSTSNSWSFHTYSGNFYLNKNGSSDAKASRLFGHANGYTFGSSARTNANVTITSWLEVTGSASSTMSYSTTNPRITFSDNGSQAVGIVYTDYDSYRATKGLKVMDVDNSDTGNVWLEVQGYTYSNGYIKNGSSDSYVLLGGGGHTHLDSIVWYTLTADLSSLSNTNYYPVLVNGIPYFRRIRIRVNGEHTANFSERSDGKCYIWYTEEISGSGWSGSSGLARIIFSHEEWGGNGKAILHKVDQMTNSSKEVFWLRGGAKYTISSNYYGLSLEYGATSYTYNSQTVNYVSGLQNFARLNNNSDYFTGESVGIKSRTAQSLYISGVTWLSTWNWSGQSGQPSWIWGSNDGANMYVWNPSNFNVTSAGYLRDRSTGTATYVNYGAAGLGLGSITWITCWNGYELRAISKGELGGLTNVYQHTGNNVDYPLVWSNQNNTSTVQANQLHKSYADLVYNPANKAIKTSRFQSSLTTSTHIAGLNGTNVPFNVTAAAGYNMALRIVGTGGVYNLGVYNNSFTIVYGAQSIIDAGTNSYSHAVSLMNVNGVTQLKNLIIDGNNHCNETTSASYRLYVSGTAYHTGTLYVAGQPAIQTSAGTGNWNYIRMHNGSNFWDFATLSSSNSGAIEFRPGGESNIGPFINTNGRVQMNNIGNSTWNYDTSAAWIREYHYGGSQSDTWGNAPRLGWHWSGRVAAQIGLSSNGWLYEAPLTNTNFYRIVVEGSTGVTWGINISGNADTVDGYHASDFLRKVTVANNTTNNFNTFENMTLTGRGDPTTGASLSNAPWTGGGPAGGYGVLTYLWSGYGTQMAWGYGSNRVYIRYKYYNSGAVWNTTWDSLALSSDLNNYYTKTTSDDRYVNVTGDTMTGLLTLTYGNSHNGVKIGNVYVNAINGDLILQNNTAIRFGGDSWDYDIWAGLKYISSSKTVYLGIADKSIFAANNAQSGGNISMPGIEYLNFNNNTPFYNNSGSTTTSTHNANDMAYSGHWYYTSNGPSTSIGASTSDGALYSQAYSTSWVGQIAQDYRNGGLYVRGKNNGTWKSWYRVYDSRTTYVSSGKGYIGGTEITQVNNADTVDSMHASQFLQRLPWWTSGNGNNINNIANGTTFAYTNHNAPTNGVFVAFSGTHNSYQLQLQGQYNGENLYFRNKNGDNGTWNAWRYVIHSGNMSSLFTAFSGGGISSSGNTMSQANHSITVGGTTKTAGSSSCNIINSHSASGGALSSSANTMSLSAHSDSVNGVSASTTASSATIINSLSVSKLTSTSSTNLTVAITINGKASSDAAITNMWSTYSRYVYQENSNSNSTYRLVWTNASSSTWTGTLYHTDYIYCNPSTDAIYCNTIYSADKGSSTDGGVSLHSTSDPMTYGIAFRGTGTYGTFGGVTSDWATYFTMNDNTARGWIFRRGSTNVASVDGAGHFYGTITGSSWIDGQRYNRALINVVGNTDSSSFWPVLRYSNSSRWYTVGVLGTNLYFMSSAQTKTDNGYDIACYINMDNGLFVGSFSGTFNIYQCSNDKKWLVGTLNSKAVGGRYLGTSNTEIYMQSGNVYALSDARFKKNIQDILNEDVYKLFKTDNAFIRQFDWKDSNLHTYGFIAQELLEYCPEAVDYDENDDKYAVTYNVAFAKIIGAMFKKIKEQDKIIKELQEKVLH